MRIGVPKEIKNHEYRVGLVPASVRELVEHGHDVWVETLAGAGIGFSDEDYQQAGARLAASAAEVFEQAELIVKVKEPQLEECRRLNEGHTLFTYLHLAADPAQARALMQSNSTAIAYETVTAPDGGLPLLTPMSEVAGRMSVQVGTWCLQKANGGSGVLLGGVPGVAPGRVVILGGGVAGSNAADMAVGLGAEVTILERNIARLRHLNDIFGGRVRTLYSTTESIEQEVLHADLVVGSVLVAGAAAPKLVTRDMVKRMRQGSAMVDISIDQGGCFETSRPTSHADPIYEVDGVIHYCVTNMPGAVARTSTFALNNVTLPFVTHIADKGWRNAFIEDVHLARGLNVHAGKLRHEAVARDLGLAFEPYPQAA